MDQNSTRIAAGKVLRIIIISVVALFIGTCIFVIVKICVGGRHALRDAKDVRMSLCSADIEMYAMGKTVYNPSRKNGLEEGVKGMVDQLVDVDGSYSITSYDAVEHELSAMTYRDGNYIVYFKKNGENITWDVNYFLNVYHYDESDVVAE